MTTIAQPHLPNYNITFEKLGVDDEEWEYYFGPVRVRIEHNPDNDPVQPFKAWYGEYDDDYETFDTMEGAVEQVERWLRQWAEYFTSIDKPKGWIALKDKPVPLQTFLCSKDPKLPPVVLRRVQPSLWASEGTFYYRWSEVTDRFTHYKPLVLQEES